MDIGTIKTITLNGDSLECVVDFGADDVDPKCVLYCGANRTEYPLPGDEVVVDRSGAESVILGVFVPVSDLGSGESVLSGRNIAGIVVSSVKVANDGQVQINGGGRSTVAFPDLKTAFDQLVSNFNSHIHTTTATVGTGPAGIISTPTASSAASVDSAESDTVEVP